MTDLNDLFKAAAVAKRELKEQQENSTAGQALKKVQERLKKNNDVAELMEVFVEKKPVVKEVIREVVVEKPVIEQSFQQPQPPVVDQNIVAIQQKLKFLEQAIGKIAATGPGSGEVNLRWLDDVNRASINDNWVMEYDAATKKFQFTEDVGPLRTLRFNTAGPQNALVPGQMAWNPYEDCLDVRQEDGTTLQLGLEQYFQIHNSTGSTLLNGEVVMFSGVDIDDPSNPIPTVQRYAANATATPLYIVGVMTSDVADGGHGRATAFGKIHDVDTTGAPVGETWARGDLLWAHPTLPGKLTKVRPTAPDVATSIAAVLYLSATAGVLLVRPTIWPRLFYGDWYSTQTQTHTQINTPKRITLNNDGFVSGFTNNAGVITAQNAGLYDFQFSIQITSSKSSAQYYWIWYRKNGVDAPNSATKLSISSNSIVLAPSWNFPVSMQIGDTFELMWAADSLQVSIENMTPTTFCPAIPSVILTVKQINL